MLRNVLISIAGVLAGALLCLAALMWTHGEGRKAAFRHELTRELASMPCDLSVAGEYRAEVATDYLYGHGLLVLIELPNDAPAGDSGQDVRGFDPRLLGTAGTVEVRSDAGTRNARTKTDVIDGQHCWPHEGMIQLARVAGNSQGRHTMVVTITEPAVTLAGVPQRLVIKNSVCGCELMGVVVGYVVEAVCVLVAIGLGGAAIQGWRSRPRGITDSSICPVA